MLVSTSRLPETDSTCSKTIRWLTVAVILTVTTPRFSQWTAPVWVQREAEACPERSTEREASVERVRTRPLLRGHNHHHE